MAYESYEANEVPLTSPGPPPVHPARRHAVLAAALAGAVFGATVVGIAWGVSSDGDGDTATSSAGVGQSFTLNGQLKLMDDWQITTEDNGHCNTSQGASDIHHETPVTVYDADGTIVATGALGYGTPDSDDASACDYPILVPAVPSGSRFYSVEIAHREKITVSRENAEGGSITVTLD